MFAILHRSLARRSFVCLAMALILLVTQTGCSGIPLFATPEPVKVRFLFIEGMADYTSLAETYQKSHANVIIELVSVTPSRNPTRDLQAQIVDADALRTSVEGLPDDLAKAFLPLDSYISTDRNFPQSDIFPGVLDGLKLDGKQIGLPAGINPFVVYYIPNKLKLAGVETPSPTWTMEDFVVTATSLNDTSRLGDPRYMYGYCTRPDSPDPLIMSYLFGGGVIDDPYQPTQPTLNHPENVNALIWYASLRNDLEIIPKAPSANEYYRLIASQSCGFWTDWMDRAVYMGLPETQVGMLPLPGYRQPFGAANVDGYFILAGTEHPQETYEWLRFLMEQEGASGRLIPPLKASIQSDEYAARVSPGTLAVAQNLPSDTIVLGLELYRDQRFGSVVELYMRAAVQAMSGEVDVQSALDEAQQAAEVNFK